MFMGLTQPAFIIAFLLIIVMPRFLNYLMAAVTVLFIVIRRYLVTLYIQHIKIPKKSRSINTRTLRLQLLYKSVLSKFGMTLTLLSYANIPESQLDLLIRMGAMLGVILSATSSGSGNLRTAFDATFGGIMGAVIGSIWFLNKEIRQQENDQLTAPSSLKLNRIADTRSNMTTPININFDTGETDIPTHAHSVLDKFATDLMENSGRIATIIGHTDDSGNDAINNSLSIDRAAQIRQYLMGKGIASTRIQIEGRSSHEPIASNDTSAGRAKNRRVELYINEPSNFSAQNQTRFIKES